MLIDQKTSLSFSSINSARNCNASSVISTVSINGLKYSHHKKVDSYWHCWSVNAHTIALGFLLSFAVPLFLIVYRFTVTNCWSATSVNSSSIIGPLDCPHAQQSTLGNFLGWNPMHQHWKSGYISGSILFFWFTLKVGEFVWLLKFCLKIFVALWSEVSTIVVN